MKRVDVATVVASTLLVALTWWMIVQVRSASPSPPDVVVLPVPAAPRPAAVEAPARRIVKARPLSPASHSDVEVCGLGNFALPVPTREAEAALDAAVIEPLARQAREQFVAVLGNSNDDYERALGHFIATRTGDDGSRREALAAMAQRSSDARSYSLALAACGPRSAEASHCDGLSSEQWARLDPDNALPWLRVAEEARQRGDAAALTEALFRASRSRVLDSDWHGAARLLQRPDLKALPTAQRLALWVDLLGIWAAIPTPGLQLPLQQCRQAVEEPNRQQLCSDLATLFVERHDTLLGFRIGIRLAEHAGWSEDRRQRLTDEADALFWTSEQPLAGEAPTYSCDWWRGQERFTVELAGKGELGALHERIVESGRGIAELAKAKRAALAEARLATTVATAR